MRKLIYFIALSFGLLILLSCVQALTGSLEVMTMDPAERQDYISLSDEEKDKYLQMDQYRRDQFRVDHDPEVIALQKQRDVAKQRLATARAELDNVSSKKDTTYGPHEKYDKILPGQWTYWQRPKAKENRDIKTDPNVVWAKRPIFFDRPFRNPPSNPSMDILGDRWNFWMDNVRKWQVEVYNLEQQLSNLKQQKLKSYAESREAWEAKNKQAGAHTSGGCFTAETLVLMESGFKRIADIKAGDRVLTVDSKGNRAVNEVVRHYILSNNHYYIINGNIKVTARHLFYMSDGDKRVQDLQMGDRIKMSDGTFETIVSKERIAGDLTVYNLDVAENDNFFVSSDGARGYLVHNCGSK